jgi:phosphotransferase system  glucose/maltose/N-acetylglucosamine-specific IIC component
MRKQASYQPVFEDWLFHFVLPLLAYLILAASAFAAPAYTSGALLGVGGATLLLLFIGIHNAWDAVMYHVFAGKRDTNSEQRRQQS